jgi:hypothetical protein
VTELSGDDAEIIVGRRSHALALLNVR